MKIDEKLITLRKSQGLSQDDLANKLDVSRQAVYKWETGQATPDISKLKILSVLYNVSIDNLLNDDEDIIYINTAATKPAYSKVTVKKTLDHDHAETDNLNLYPEEAKKLKIRKTVLLILNILVWGSLALAVIFFILACMAENDELSLKHSSTTGTFIVILLISSIVKFIVGKVLFPKIILARTYFNNVKQKSEEELKSKYETVTMLQYDLLAWFVYDEKAKTFGFYFDGDMQFSCPISNYAGLVITPYETLFGVEVKYFTEEGKLTEYKFSLSNFRQFWIHETKTVEDAQSKQYELNALTKHTLTEIKHKLDIEKNR